jgi:flagellar biosynthesis anti-sigma factor FlgM
MWFFRQEQDGDKKIALYGTQKPTKPEKTELKLVEQAKLQSTEVTAYGEASDHVQFSNSCQEIEKFKKVVMRLADIRMECVGKIQNMLLRGTYQVDPDSVADKILDEEL